MDERRRLLIGVAGAGMPVWRDFGVDPQYWQEPTDIMLALPDNFAYEFRIKFKSAGETAVFAGNLYYGVILDAGIPRIRCRFLSDQDININAFITGDFVGKVVDLFFGWNGTKVFGQLLGGEMQFSGEAVCPPRLQCANYDNRQFRSINAGEIYHLELIDYSTGVTLWAASRNDLRTDSTFPTISRPAVRPVWGEVGQPIEPVSITPIAGSGNAVMLALDSHYTIPDGLTLSLTDGVLTLSGTPVTVGDSIAVVTATSPGCEPTRIVLVFRFVAAMPVRLYNAGIITSGGTSMSGLTLTPGYSAVVTSGGTINGFRVLGDGAAVYISSGGVASGLVASGTNIDVGGLIALSSGGSAYDTTLNNYGVMRVYDGGYASRLTQNYRGNLHVSGGLVENVTLNNVGCIYASSGVVDSITMTSGGRGYVFGYGGELRNVTVRGISAATGDLNLAFSDAAGTAMNVTMDAYSTYVLGNGDVHKGTLTINSVSANVAFNSGSTLDFIVALADATGLGDYLVNDWSKIATMNGNVRITVSPDQGAGQYSLAQNAAGFNKPVELTDGTTTYGTLTVGGTPITYAGKTYAIHLLDNNLVLEIMQQ